MRTRFRNGWTQITTITVLGVGGLLIACRFTPGCPLASALEDSSPSHAIATTGEDAMSTDIRTLRKVEHADEATFHQQVLRSDVPVLVDFYADWCTPCRALAPTLEELAREMPGARIVKVDVDANSRLAARYGVSSIPSLLVFKDGEVSAAHVGLADKKQLRALITR